MSASTPRIEESIQRHVVLWCKNHANPLYHGIFHIPNGEKRDKNTARKLKRLGVKAGIPDLCLPLSGGLTFWLEVKKKKGRLSLVQKRVIDDLRSKGHIVEVAYGYDEAIEKLKRLDYMQDVSEVVKDRFRGEF
jgi:hypothetical protein